jgi:hypothetical protein
VNDYSVALAATNLQPLLPRILVEIGGFVELHAAFLDESRTHGRGWMLRQVAPWGLDLQSLVLTQTLKRLFRWFFVLSGTLLSMARVRREAFLPRIVGYLAAEG